MRDDHQRRVEVPDARAIDAVDLLAAEATPTRWIVDGWLAEGTSALLGAHGGTGKSWLVLQVAACIASGTPFCGIATARRRVLLYSCEDRVEVVQHRLHRIRSALGLTIERGWLHVVDQTRKPAELVGRGEYGVVGVTLVYEQLRQAIERTGAELLIVDSVSDAYGGAEIARAEVRRYITETQALVLISGAVLHIAHVDKSHARGAASGQAYSGSTAWHNSVRTRWELSRVIDEAEDGRPSIDDPRRLLTLAKSNYGPAGMELPMRLDPERGLFVPNGTPGDVVDAIRERTEREAILRAFASVDDPVPAATTGQRTAWHVLSARPDFPDRMRNGRDGRRRFWRVIEDARAMRLIEEVSIRRADRHFIATLVLTDEGRRACGQCGQ
jgi:RecA-family ATPase